MCDTMVAHCENCGRADCEATEMGDQGYSGCCNELVVSGDYCRGHHVVNEIVQREVDEAMLEMGYEGNDARHLFITEHGQSTFNSLFDRISDRAEREYARSAR